jgi:hypothetical protein
LSLDIVVAVSGVKWENGPLFGSLGFIVVEVATDVGENATGTADGQSSGVTALGHRKTWVAVLVKCRWVSHLFIWNGSLESEKTVNRILIGMKILGIGFNHASEVES